MAKITLHSTRTFKAFADISYEDKTNKALEATQGKRIIPTWQDKYIVIKEGDNEYDEEIVKWTSVQTAIKARVCYVVESAEQIQKRIDAVVNAGEEKKVRKPRKAKEETLADLGEEEPAKDDDSLADLA